MNMRQLPATLFISVLFLFSNATPSRAQTSTSPDHPTIKVIERFWTLLGEGDREGMKQILGWPVTFVEITPTQTKNPWVMLSSADFDKEYLKSNPRPEPRHRSEFYGTRISDFKVEMLNESLALVTYLCRLPKDISEPNSKPFNAVAILRKDTLEPYSWKIIFTVVPN